MTPTQRPPTQILTPKEAAALLRDLGIHRTPQTLAKYRCLGGGPVFVKIGVRQVGYPEPGIRDWADSLISAPRRSTSESHTTTAAL